ncbi:MAG: hypothetical protein Q7S15_01430 [bacterium]|nr:hypothetical protein [bacterium]
MKKNQYVAIGIVALALIAGAYLLITRETGIVEITVPLAETTVFIDNKRKVTTSTDNEVVTLSISAREHSVLVATMTICRGSKRSKLEKRQVRRFGPFWC